jgi:hypothetical protein
MYQQIYGLSARPQTPGKVLQGTQDEYDLTPALHGPATEQTHEKITHDRHSLLPVCDMLLWATELQRRKTNDYTVR